MSFKCLTELNEKIAETDRVAHLAKHMLEDDSVVTRTAEFVDNTARRTTANAMTKSALVLLCGYFEGFLKKLLEEFVEEINELKVPLSDARSDLLFSIFQHSITDNRKKSLPKLMILKDCISGETHFPLTQDIIGSTKGNPTVDTVEAIFQRIGIPEIIDKLSIKDYELESTYTTVRQSQALYASIDLAVSGDLISIQKVISLIDEKWAPKKQRRDAGYVGRIQELLKKRNRIAHGENWGEQVTPNELLEFNRDILRLCSGINDHLSAELALYKAQ